MHLTTFALILPACMALPEHAPLVSGPQSIAQAASLMPETLENGPRSSNPGPLLSGLQSATRYADLQSVHRMPVVVPRSTALISGQQSTSMAFKPKGGALMAAVTGTATIWLSATDTVSTIIQLVDNLPPGTSLNVTFTAATLLPLTNWQGQEKRVACNFSGIYIPPGPSPTSPPGTGFRLDSHFTPTTSYPISSGAMANPNIQCSGLGA